MQLHYARAKHCSVTPYLCISSSRVLHHSNSSVLVGTNRYGLHIHERAIEYVVKPALQSARNSSDGVGGRRIDGQATRTGVDVCYDASTLFTPHVL